MGRRSLWQLGRGGQHGAGHLSQLPVPTSPHPARGGRTGGQGTRVVRSGEAFLHTPEPSLLLPLVAGP